MINLLLISLEKLFQLLPHDIDSQKAEKMAGKVLAFHIQPWPTVFVIFHRDGFNFASTYVHAADAEVFSDTLKSFRALTKLKNFYDLKDYFTLKGDMSLVEDFYRFYLKPQYQWEDLAAPIIGDKLTEIFSRTNKKFRQKLEDSQQQFSQNLTEYLQEEARILPGKYECENFYEEINAMRLETERLSARVKILRSKKDAE